jgi:diguanylate cyclase (GGDEF)-like protein
MTDKITADKMTSPDLGAMPARPALRQGPRARGSRLSAAHLLQGLRVLTCRMTSVALIGLLALWAIAPPAAATDGTTPRAKEIETYLAGYPKRALAELTELVARADMESAAERRYLHALYGQSLVAAGRSVEALGLAERIEREADARDDSLDRATALLVRGGVESQSGDYAKANALAKEARALVGTAAEPHLAYWAAMTIGITARGRGQLEESLGSLHDALAAAQGVDDAYRQSYALYQLSTLYLALKQPQNALDASRQAFAFAEVAGIAHAMVNARMAESAAMELLDDPVRELAAMQEALAIARKAQSKVAEGLALINLADIQLRRKRFNDALDLSRRSLALAREFDNAGAMATSKANMGFALFGLGRSAEGKRLADEALADYERTGATAEIASLLGEYSHYLEKSGDYKAALALYHRERKLYDDIAATAHQKSVLEMQGKYESEKGRREIELLNRQNDLNSAELENRVLQERIWWLLATIFAVSFMVVAVLYRKLRVTNALLATRNRELNVSSSRDPLTALYNRRYFQDFMRDDLARPERRHIDDDQQPIHALLLIDIDRFKETNDRHGHAAGDSVLVVVAQRLRETLRETDMIVRWGGEEFLVFVPATNAEKLDEIATRIMDAIAAEPIMHRGNSIRVTASIGYAPMPLPPENIALSWERAISLIDMALYMAKIHGRNCAYGIRGLRRSDDEALATIERDLAKAWECGMVDMHLQPGPDVGTFPIADSPRATARAGD